MKKTKHRTAIADLSPDGAHLTDEDLARVVGGARRGDTRTKMATLTLNSDVDVACD
jgi:hypothetical protein